MEINLSITPETPPTQTSSSLIEEINIQISSLSGRLWTSSQELLTLDQKINNLYNQIRPLLTSDTSSEENKRILVDSKMLTARASKLIPTGKLSWIQNIFTRSSVKKARETLKKTIDKLDPKNIPKTTTSKDGDDSSKIVEIKLTLPESNSSYSTEIDLAKNGRAQDALSSIDGKTLSEEQKFQAYLEIAKNSTNIDSIISHIQSSEKQIAFLTFLTNNPDKENSTIQTMIAELTPKKAPPELKLSDLPSNLQPLFHETNPKEEKINSKTLSNLQASLFQNLTEAEKPEKEVSSKYRNLSNFVQFLLRNLDHPSVDATHRLSETREFILNMITQEDLPEEDMGLLGGILKSINTTLTPPQKLAADQTSNPIQPDIAPSTPTEEIDSPTITSPIIEPTQIAPASSIQTLPPSEELANFIGNPSATKLLMGFIGSHKIDKCITNSNTIALTMHEEASDTDNTGYEKFVDDFIKKQDFFSLSRTALNLVFNGYPKAEMPQQLKMTKTINNNGTTTLAFSSPFDGIHIKGSAIHSITYPTNPQKENTATLTIGEPDSMNEVAWLDGKDQSLTVKL